MEALLEFLARSLVDDPDAVAVEGFDEDDGTIVLELTVADDDTGKVIGRGGRTVTALRAVLRAVAARDGDRVLVDVIDQPGDARPAGRMRIDIFTLFPAWFDWMLEQRHLRNAAREGHAVDCVDLRATTPLSGGQVDDTPYGGGAGMVIRVDVVEAALEARYGQDAGAGRRIVALAAGGRQFDDALASELASERDLTFLCGRYEGVDERVRENLANDALSVGPYVLSGGELAAMVVCDTVLRKLPGALGDEHSPIEESFSAALEGGVEYPHYTRPASYRGWGVPEVLLSGHHEQVRGWRLEEARRRSATR